MCLTHMRLKANRIMRMATPPDQMVSIIGMRTSSQEEIFSVRVIGLLSVMRTSLSETAVHTRVSGSITINVAKAITMISQRAIVERRVALSGERRDRPSITWKVGQHKPELPGERWRQLVTQ